MEGERQTRKCHLGGLEIAPAAPWGGRPSSALPRVRAMSSSNSFTLFELRFARSSSSSRSRSRSSSYGLRCRSSLSATPFSRRHLSRSPVSVHVCPWCACATVCDPAVSLQTPARHARTRTHTYEIATRNPQPRSARAETTCVDCAQLVLRCRVCGLWGRPTSRPSGPAGVRRRRAEAPLFCEVGDAPEHGAVFQRLTLTLRAAPHAGALAARRQPRGRRVAGSTLRSPRSPSRRTPSQIHGSPRTELQYCTSIQYR